MAVCIEINTKHTNTPCAKDAELNAKRGAHTAVTTMLQTVNQMYLPF